MQSPFNVRNWILFLLINVLVSAVTAFLMFRFLTQAASRPDPAVVAVNGATAAQSQPPPQPQATTAAVTESTTPAAVLQPVDASTAESPKSLATAEPVPTAAQSQTQAAASAELATPVNTPSAAEPVNVRISTVVFAGQRGREAVVIVNEGNQVDMTGWTLSTPRGQTFTFGTVLLFKDSFINVHTTNGVDVPTDLFWNQEAAVWRKGDEATLKRGAEVIATFTVK